MTDNLPVRETAEQPKTTQELEAAGEATQDQEVNQNVTDDNK